jgi:hypothetical protein
MSKKRQKREINYFPIKELKKSIARFFYTVTDALTWYFDRHAAMGIGSYLCQQQIVFHFKASNTGGRTFCSRYTNRCFKTNS